MHTTLKSLRTISKEKRLCISLSFTYPFGKEKFQRDRFTDYPNTIKSAPNLMQAHKPKATIGTGSYVLNIIFCFIAIT